MPAVTTNYLILSSAKDLTAALRLPTSNSLLPPTNTITRKALLQLSNIFANLVNPNDDTIISTNRPPPAKPTNVTAVPRVSNPPLKLPRVQTEHLKLPRVPNYVPPSSTKAFLLHNNARKSIRCHTANTRRPTIPPPQHSSRSPHPNPKYVTNASLQLPPNFKHLIQQELLVPTVFLINLSTNSTPFSTQTLANFLNIATS